MNWVMFLECIMTLKMMKQGHFDHTVDYVVDKVMEQNYDVQDAPITNIHKIMVDHCLQELVRKWIVAMVSWAIMITHTFGQNAP